MDLARGAVYGAVASILLVTLASGPVGVVTLAREPVAQSAELGTGEVEVTGASLPGTVFVERGEFGAESYYLRVPDARLEVASVTGRPVVNYRLEIDRLGYARESVHFFDSSKTGLQGLSLSEDTIDANDLEADRYDGQVLVVVRTDANDTVVARRNVTVVVTE